MICCHRDKVVQDFLDKIGTSGYSREQTREIVQAGLKGYEGRRKREAHGITPILRSKHTAQKGIDLRKLLENNTWFRKEREGQNTTYDG